MARRRSKIDLRWSEGVIVLRANILYHQFLFCSSGKIKLTPSAKNSSQTLETDLFRLRELLSDVCAKQNMDGCKNKKRAD